MSKNLESLALGKLVPLLNRESAEKLKQALVEFDQGGLHMASNLVNHPIQKYQGRTLVHLATGNGFNFCLDLLLKYKGNNSS